MINDKHKFIFVSVAKTGTRAIISALRKYGRLENPSGCKDSLHVTDINHVPLFVCKNFTHLHKFNEYFKFGFVRNPYARMVSAYHYNIKWCAENKPEELRKANLKSFKQWIITHNEGWSCHKYGSQYNFVEGCDYIGRFENLQQDFNTICDRIGIPRQQLPHKNKSKHKHYTEYYDDETKQIVAEKYAKDIEYFGYEFGI